MGHPRGKFRVRIRKMKPEPIIIRRRQAWGKSEKKEETVLGTIFVSLICFKLFRVSRRNDVEEDDVPTSDPEQVQIEIGDDHTIGSTAGHGPVFSNGDASMCTAASNRNHDDHMYPNLIRVLECIQSSSSLERMSSPLPGAIGEADTPSFCIGGGAAAMAGPSSLPALMSTQEVEQAHNAGDLELASLPSCESLQCAAEDQQKTKDRKKKKSKKSKSKNKKESKKKQAAGKTGKNVKSSSKSKEDNSCSKIPSVKEWAKQEEKKKKVEKKQQKKELKQEKKKQKQMEKQAAKAEKQKKAQKLKEEKESKKAEKEAAKAKKAAEKAEKAAAKAKEAALKAEAKKREKQSKLALRMQQMLEESDKQMTADLERDRIAAEDRKRKQEAKAREVLKSIAKTEQIIKTLQEKLERKEKKVAQLSTRRDGKRCISMLVAFKLNYKIADYNRKINSLSSVINKLKKKVEAKQKEVEKLAPHLLETEVTQEDGANPCSSRSNNSDHTDDVAADNDSVLDMLSYFDSKSECSDDDDEEEEEEEGGELHTEGSTHSNVQEILRKAQESLQKMDEDRHTEVPSIFFR